MRIVRGLISFALIVEVARCTEQTPVFKETVGRNTVVNDIVTGVAAFHPLVVRGAHFFADVAREIVEGIPSEEKEQKPHRPMPQCMHETNPTCPKVGT